MPGVSSLRISSDVVWFGMRIGRGHLVLMLLLAAVSLDSLAPGSLRSTATRLWYAQALFLCLAGVASVAGHAALHAFAARRLGMQSGPVDLALPGTLTEDGFSPPDPRSEALVALAGPVVNVLLALVFGSLWLALRPFEYPGEPVLAGLALINGGLALFNLLPGYPLDGGRVLRAFVWYITDSLVSGTRVAAFYAQVIGMVTMLVGFLLLALGDLGSVLGAWTMLLGWTLDRRSRESLTTTIWHELGRTWSIDEAALGQSRMLDGDTRLDLAVDDLLLTTRHGPLLITDGDQVVGAADLNSLRAVPRTRWREMLLKDIAAPVAHLPRIDDQQMVGALIAHLDAAPQQQVLIEHRGRVRGIVDRQTLYARMQARTALPLRRPDGWRPS